MSNYLVQVWENETLIEEFNTKFLGKAKVSCLVQSTRGYTCRIFYDYPKVDHTEVWKEGKMVRSGPFAQTTMVRVET
jgi:hypothetical protein